MKISKIQVFLKLIGDYIIPSEKNSSYAFDLYEIIDVMPFKRYCDQPMPILKLWLVFLDVLTAN